ncbi:MAG: CBS domain-containing protein [Gammaproteobacteria bacterium]|jgi:CBS-domain-containing membrane protein
MKNLRRSFAVKNLSASCGLISPGHRPGHYHLDSPATSLLVDFARVHPITAGEFIAVTDALELMRVNRIRSLMIIDGRNEFVGVVTAMDLMGGKPMAYANEAGIPLSEVQVKNIMLPKSRLMALSRADVEEATIGEVLQMLKSQSQQHLLVFEGTNDRMQICGMFSISDFKRALGINLHTAPVGYTFSELERIINENKEVM